MAGQIAGLIRDIKPVNIIIEDIICEADRILDAMIKYKQ
jgi:hypothetical protein